MGTTVAEKLLINPNSTIWLSHSSYLPLLTPLPTGVRQSEVMATASVAIVFAESADAARDIVLQHKDQLATPGALWVAYQKALRDDINAESLAPVMAEFGMRPEEQLAVDNTWSATRFGAHGEDH